MSRNFHENFERPTMPLPPDRSTGLVLAALAAFVAYFLRSSPAGFYAAGGVAAALVTISLLRPIWLRPLNIVWMRLALLLSKIVNPVVMFVLFALVIVPSGLLMRLRHDPLRKHRLLATESYWIPRTRDDRSSMRNQF